MKPELRRPLIAGNWKLYQTLAGARALCAAIARGLSAEERVEVVVAPVFTALSSAREAIGSAPIALAAQDCYEQPEGAFTGEVSAPLLQDVGCDYVIVGHSERRSVFGETDEMVRRKTAAVLAGGLCPIVCLGETLEIREAGQTEAHVLRQLDVALDGLAQEQAARVVIAYEPVWAIGTGRTAKPKDAQIVHATLRARLAERFGSRLSDATRILYGGSVKPDNAAALLAEPDIDGALVGGASLQAESFLAIVSAARTQLG